MVQYIVANMDTPTLVPETAFAQGRSPEEAFVAYCDHLVDSHPPDYYPGNDAVPELIRVLPCRDYFRNNYDSRISIIFMVLADEEDSPTLSVDLGVADATGRATKGAKCA